MIPFAGRTLTRLFDAVLWPARDAAPAWGIALVALLTAAGVLLVYRLVSDQAAIRATKRRIQGHLLGIYIYRDSPAAMLGSLGRVWSDSLRYMGRSMLPLAAAIVPVALVCVQLEIRYGRRPLAVGESAVLSAEAGGRAAAAAAGGVRVETPSVLSGGGETDWRVRATGEGGGEVTVDCGGGSASIPVSAGGALRPLCRERVRSPLLQALLCPACDPLPPGGQIRSLRVGYPPLAVRLAGMRMHWSIAFFALALVFGLALKRLFGVEF